MSPGACLAAWSECSTKLGRETGFHVPGSFLTALSLPDFLTASKVLGSMSHSSAPLSTWDSRGCRLLVLLRVMVTCSTQSSLVLVTSLYLLQLLLEIQALTFSGTKELFCSFSLNGYRMLIMMTSYFSKIWKYWKFITDPIAAWPRVTSMEYNEVIMWKAVSTHNVSHVLST